MDPRPIACDERLRTRVAANLARFERREAADSSLVRAAVAVVLLADESDHASFILTRRTDKLRRHAGQWALPGGRLDPGETLEQTALRECAEEVGLELEQDSVLGVLDDYPTRSGFAITPVVVWGGSDCALEPDPDEVAELYRVGLHDLSRPGVPHFRGIPESDRPVISIPLVGVQIHAPTAAVLYQVAEVALAGRNTRVDHYEQPVFAWK